MRAILKNLALVLAMLGRWIAKVTKRAGKPVVEWVQERVIPAIEDGFENAVHAVANLPAQAVSLPGRVINSLVPGRASGIVPPAPEEPSMAPQQERDRAAEKAHQEAQDTDLALSVRAAARALLRDQEPTVALPAPVDAWLRHVGESAWVYLAAMKPEQVSAVLQGRGTAHVPAFEADAWVDARPAVRPLVAAVPAPQAAHGTPEQVRDAINSALSAGARERLAERWGLNNRPAQGDSPTLRRASGIRP